MFCVNCGKALPESGSSFCPNCGEPVEGRPGKTVATADAPISQPSDGAAGTMAVLDRKLKLSPSIFVAAILILAAIAVFSLGKRDAIRDVKDIVFDSYGDATVGKAIERSLSGVKWRKERLDKDNFIVTATGFDAELESDVSIVFRAKYRDGYVYATVESVGLDDEMADDLFSIAIVMAEIYDN